MAEPTHGWEKRHESNRNPWVGSVIRGDSPGFKAREQVAKKQETLPEPGRPLTPSLSPNGGEGARRADEGVSGFMAAMRDHGVVETLHEPCPERGSATRSNFARQNADETNGSPFDYGACCGSQSRDPVHGYDACRKLEIFPLHEHPRTRDAR